MAIQEIPPYATGRLSFLPKGDAEWYVHNYHGFCFDPNNPDRFGCGVRIAKLTPRDVPSDLAKNMFLEARAVFAPFSSFAYLGIGNIFQDGRMMERAAGYRSVYRTTFRPRYVTDGEFGRLGVGEPVGVRENSTFEINDTQPRRFYHDTPLLMSYSHGRPTFLPMCEILRFYLCGFSRLSEALIHQYAFPEFGHADVFDDAETGLDGKTFVVSPTQAFAERATATQLAIILAHPDILGLVAEFALFLRHMRFVDSTDNVMRIGMPAGAQFLKFASRDIVFLEKNAKRTKASMFGQILSDGRELAFDRLIIRDPREQSLFDGSVEAGSAATYMRSADGPVELDEGLHTDRHPLHGGSEMFGEREYESPHFRIGQHFTGLQAVPIVVDRKSPTSRAHRKVKDTVAEWVFPRKRRKTYTDAPGAPVEGLLRFRQKMHPENKRFSVGSKLFLPVDVHEFVRVAMRDVPVDSRTQVTLDAARRLWQMSMLRRPELPRFAWPTALRLNIDLLGGRSRTRYLVYGTVKVSDRYGVWVELVRDGEKAVSLGLVLRKDERPIKDRDVVRIIEHYKRRVELRGQEDRADTDSYTGVWPTSREYEDIVGGRITHNPPNNTPYHLAATIDRKFQTLATTK